MEVTYIYFKMKPLFYKYVGAVLLLFFSLAVQAQHGVPEPKWVRHIPTASSKTFYYRVTYGEGVIYDKAYTNAFAKAIYENACKRGITVDIDMSMDAIEREVQEQVNVDQRTMKLYLNKACEYWEVNPNGVIRLYVLWQIGQNGKSDPNFEPYEECDAL